MPWTVEQTREYQAAWRARNPTYQRELKAWRRKVEGKWRKEFEAKIEKKPVKSTSGTVREAYPWEND